MKTAAALQLGKIKSIDFLVRLESGGGGASIGMPSAEGHPRGLPEVEVGGRQAADVTLPPAFIKLWVESGGCWRYTRMEPRPKARSPFRSAAPWPCGGENWLAKIAGANQPILECGRFRLSSQRQTPKRPLQERGPARRRPPVNSAWRAPHSMGTWMPMLCRSEPLALSWERRKR